MEFDRKQTSVVREFSPLKLIYSVVEGTDRVELNPSLGTKVGRKEVPGMCSGCRDLQGWELDSPLALFSWNVKISPVSHNDPPPKTKHRFKPRGFRLEWFAFSRTDGLAPVYLMLRLSLCYQEESVLPRVNAAGKCIRPQEYHFYLVRLLPPFLSHNLLFAPPLFPFLPPSLFPFFLFFPTTFSVPLLSSPSFLPHPLLSFPTFFPFPQPSLYPSSLPLPSFPLLSFLSFFPFPQPSLYSSYLPFPSFPLLSFLFFFPFSQPYLYPCSLPLLVLSYPFNFFFFLLPSPSFLPPIFLLLPSFTYLTFPSLLIPFFPLPPFSFLPYPSSLLPSFLFLTTFPFPFSFPNSPFFFLLVLLPYVFIIILY